MMMSQPNLNTRCCDSLKTLNYKLLTLHHK
jgi:hypothetical protein